MRQKGRIRFGFFMLGVVETLFFILSFTLSLYGLYKVFVFKNPPKLLANSEIITTFVAVISLQKPLSGPRVG